MHPCPVAARLRLGERGPDRQQVSVGHQQERAEDALGQVVGRHRRYAEGRGQDDRCRGEQHQRGDLLQEKEDADVRQAAQQRPLEQVAVHAFEPAQPPQQEAEQGHVHDQAHEQRGDDEKREAAL